jgi:CubicO group peptidase (beta-lactamase class C family)
MRLERKLFLVGAVVAALGSPARDGAADAKTRVTAKLEAIRAKHGVPALAGAIVTADGLDGTWSTGERAAGSGVKVEAGDRWHLGSCTKSMTATLIALLVERGDLKWETPLPKLLPELAATMHADYREVTLVDLLCHRAGVPSDLSRDGLWASCWKREGTPTQQRRALAKTVLSWKPVHAPRTKYLYSNAGVAIAGHVAESVTGKPYEQLMQELLFDPLGIKTAIFGAPGSTKSIDEPRGHGGDGHAVEPGPGADNPPAIAPAGTCAMSLADWARYVALHLRSAKGDVKVGAITLHAATAAKLHTPWTPPPSASPSSAASNGGAAASAGAPPADDASYAMGWSVTKRDWAGGDGLVWTHNGSNNMWFCVVWLAPNASFAVLATTNVGGDGASQATDEVAATLIGEHASHAAAAK